MGVSNRNDADNELRALRRSQGGTPAPPNGYQSRSGRTQAQTGNDKAPYVWNAPFSDPMQLITFLEIGGGPHEFPNLDDWGTCFPAIDVSDYRVISLLLRVDAPRGETDFSLELIPLVQFDFGDVEIGEGKTFEAWSPIGFVNPDPTNVQVPYRPFPQQSVAQTFVQRTVGPMLLKTLPPGDTGLDGGQLLYAFDFEVASHKQFTMSIISASGVGVAASIYYTRRM
jgi:hypothetical protein